MKKRHKHKSSGLSYFQFALLRRILQPETGLKMNPAAAIQAAEAYFQAGGWTHAQAKAETRPEDDMSIFTKNQALGFAKNSR